MALKKIGFKIYGLLEFSQCVFFVFIPFDYLQCKLHSKMLKVKPKLTFFDRIIDPFSRISLLYYQKQSISSKHRLSDTFAECMTYIWSIDSMAI